MGLMAKCLRTSLGLGFLLLNDFVNPGVVFATSLNFSLLDFLLFWVVFTFLFGQACSCLLIAF